MYDFKIQQSAGDLATAVILGGGRGTRLWPLTKFRAKPAVPLAGKYRLIDIPVSLCLNSGLTKIYLLTQFNSSSLNQHIQRTYHFDQFSRRFVALLAAHQSDESGDWYQGTSDAVRRNIQTICQWNTPHIIILPGDAIFRMNLKDLLATHIENDADITVSLNTCAEEQASDFGIVRMDDSQRILELAEKPSPDQFPRLRLGEAQMEKLELNPEKPFLASMGIYVFKTKVLCKMLEEQENVDFGKHLLPKAIDRNLKLAGHVFPDFWEDIGTIKAFYEVNLALADQQPPFTFYTPDFPVHTRTRFLPLTRTGEVQVKNSLIADGCRIAKATIDHSLIGIRSVIGSDVMIKDSIMMGADMYEYGKPKDGFVNLPADAPQIGIGDGSKIEGAIIDKNAHIGENVTITPKFDQPNYDDPEERYYIRDGIVIVPKHAVLPNGLTI